MIKTKTYWTQVCPATAYTAVTATLAPLSFTGTGSAITTAVTYGANINGMTQAMCLAGAPINNWNIVAMTEMIGYGLAFLMFIVNLVAGNDGSSIHYAFWRFSQSIVLLSIL